MSWKKILLSGTVILAALFMGAYILLSTYDYNTLKPRIAEAVKNATGRELVLGEKIKLKFGLWPALVLGNIALQNASWGSRPEMITVKRLEIQMALLPLVLGHMDVRRFVLIQPDILIETDPSGKSNLSLETRERTAGSATKTVASSGRHLELPTLSVADVQIEGASVTYRDGRTGKSFSLQIDRLSASAETAGSPVRLKLKGASNGKPLEIAGTVGTWSAITTPQDCPLDLTGLFGEIHMNAKGIIRDVLGQRHIDLRLQASAKDLEDLKALVGERLAFQGPFETELRITNPSSQIYRLSDLKMGLGPSDISGFVEADLSKDRPTFSAVLASKLLDLRSVWTEKGSKTTGTREKEAQPTSHGKVFSRSPLPLEILRKSDMMMKVRGDRILLPVAVIDDLAAEIALKGGDLKIAPIQATVGGGSLNGSFHLEPKDASALIKTELKVEQVDAGRLVKDLGKEEVFEGRLSGHVEVNGRGVSEAEAMSTLNGRLVLTMSSGRIHNRYLDLLGGDISASLLQLLDPFKKQTGYTVVNCLVAGFNIHDGIAATTAFAVDTAEMSVIGEGDVNLRTEELDIPLRPMPKAGIGIPGLPKLGLGQLARPFKLAGTLAHPSLGIDTTRAAETVATAIGSIALLGPAGILTTLAQGSSGEENLCRIATEAAQKGIRLSVVEEKDKPTGLPGEAVQGLEKGLGLIGKGIEGLFGQ